MVSQSRKKAFIEKMVAVTAAKGIVCENIDDYDGANTYLWFNDTNCDHPHWRTQACNIVRKRGTGCIWCGGGGNQPLALRQQMFVEKMKIAEKDRGIVCLNSQVYKDNQSDLLFNSLNCDHEPWLSTPGTILNWPRPSGCPRCAGINKAALSERQENFVEKLANNPNSIICLNPEAYKNKRSVLLFNKLDCNHEPWKTEVKYALTSDCIHCSRGGRVSLEQRRQWFSEDMGSIYSEIGIRCLNECEYETQDSELWFDSDRCEHDPWMTSARVVLTGSNCPKCLVWTYSFENCKARLRGNVMAKLREKGILWTEAFAAEERQIFNQLIEKTAGYLMQLLDAYEDPQKLQLSIDHIVPMNLFDVTNFIHVMLASDKKNVRWLPFVANIKKRCKLDHSLLTEWHEHVLIKIANDQNSVAA